METVLDFDPASGRLVLAPDSVAAGQSFVSAMDSLMQSLADARELTEPTFASIQRQACPAAGCVRTQDLPGCCSLPDMAVTGGSRAAQQYALTCCSQGSDRV